MCDLLPDGCMAAHICPVLHGRKTSKDGQWSAPCPSCDGHRTSLSLSVGTQGRRIIWQCHGSARCSEEAVHRAMLARGIPRSCIPMRKPLKARGDAPESNEDRAKLDAIMKMLSEQLKPVDFMIRIADLLTDDDVDERTAAEQAGIPTATYYRHRPKYKD